MGGYSFTAEVDIGEKPLIAFQKYTALKWGWKFHSWRTISIGHVADNT